MRQEGVELVVGFCWSLCSLVRRIAFSKRVSKTSLPDSQSVSHPEAFISSCALSVFMLSPWYFEDQREMPL